MTNYSSKHKFGRNNSLTARLGEQLAVDWLRGNGYQVIDRNWHGGRRCEIDIVAIDSQGLLTFVEVKTRKLLAEGLSFDQSKMPATDVPKHCQARIQAFETLNWNKRRRVFNAAMSYIARHHIMDPSCQLDAIVITFRNLSHKDQQPYLEDASVFHVPRAFSDL